MTGTVLASCSPCRSPCCSLLQFDGAVKERVIQLVNNTSGCPARGTSSAYEMSTDACLTKATNPPDPKPLLAGLGTWQLPRKSWQTTGWSLLFVLPEPMIVADVWTHTISPLGRDPAWKFTVQISEKSGCNVWKCQVSVVIYSAWMDSGYYVSCSQTGTENNVNACTGCSVLPTLFGFWMVIETAVSQDWWCQAVFIGLCCLYLSLCFRLT